MKYEPIINDFNLTKMRNSKGEKLIDGFCSYIDKVTQLYFSGFAKTCFYDVLPTWFFGEPSKPLLFFRSKWE